MASEYAGFNDFNGDGYPEVIGFNSEEEKVQVWGAPSSTSIVDEVISGFEARISPNPFYDPPTYHYHISQGADVQLDVFNAQGQLIRRALSGWKTAGSHSGSLHGISRPGLYFTTWRVNGHITQTQQIIKK